MSSTVSGICSFISVMMVIVTCMSSDAQETGKTRSDDYTVTISSPDVQLSQKPGFVCLSFAPLETAFLVAIRPKPQPGLHHHISLELCAEPGFQSSDKQTDDVWDCGFDESVDRIPILNRSSACSARSNRYFDYQFQGGSSDEGSLIFPQGTGVLVGPGSDFPSIVGQFHFFVPEELVNGSTAGSAVEFTLRPLTAGRELRPVSSLLLISDGFVGKESVGTVSASWTSDQEDEMEILRLQPHWHDMNDMAIDIQVWIKRRTGEKEVILRQDPHSFFGITDVSNSSAVMQKGDQLSVECTFNNTDDTNLRIGGHKDACDVTVFYVKDGLPLGYGEVTSVDPFYKDCISDYNAFDFVWLVYNFEGRSSFHGASGDDCREF